MIIVEANNWRRPIGRLKSICEESDIKSDEQSVIIRDDFTPLTLAPAAKLCCCCRRFMDDCRQINDCLRLADNNFRKTIKTKTKTVTLNHPKFSLVQQYDYETNIGHTEQWTAYESPFEGRRNIKLDSKQRRWKSTKTFNDRNNLLLVNLNNPKKFIPRQIYVFTHKKLLLLQLSALLLISTLYIEPVKSNQIDRQYFPTTNKTGQFSVAQLCHRGSNIPVTRRVEGASLVSTDQDVDMNCTITFRTKSAHQHFIIHFEDLNLGCDDHLILFDQDADYGQPSIHDYSCRDNMASVRALRTTGTFLTIRYITDSINQHNDGFRIILTAVFDTPDCPSEYAYCRDHYCISRSLFCDGIQHCLDKSDEMGCHSKDDPNDLPYALGLLVVLVLAISLCVIVFIATIYCRRESPYSQYQHHLQRTFNPLQASSSIMFPNQPQATARYQFFQPAQMSPYVTPQHHALIAATATLPRGYSTLPLNFAGTAGRQQAGPYPQAILAGPGNFVLGPNNDQTSMNANANMNEYLMMTGLAQQPILTSLPQAIPNVNQPMVVKAGPGPGSVVGGPIQHTTTLTSLPNSHSSMVNTSPRQSQTNSGRGRAS